jgi:hypothetical protein
LKHLKAQGGNIGKPVTQQDIDKARFAAAAEAAGMAAPTPA